jgi:hypothetical protein
MARIIKQLARETHELTGNFTASVFWRDLFDSLARGAINAQRLPTFA